GTQRRAWWLQQRRVSRPGRDDYNRPVMHVLLFDIDGTLLNTGGAGQQAMEQALASVFGVTRPTVGISAAGRTDRAITHDLFTYHGIEPLPELWQRFQQAYLEQLGEILPQLEGQVL